MRLSLKKIFFNIFLMFFIASLSAYSQDNINTEEIKQQAIALYATKNYAEAQKLLENLPKEAKTEEVFLLLANIAQENNDDTGAIQNLNKALDCNYSYFKAYYNLGCIFASKKSYLLALNNFQTAIKYNKNCAEAYYNLARCQLELRDFSAAKKNLIKAINLEPQNKDFYYNLAYCYKQLNNEKQAQKILDVYNKLS